MLRQFNSFTRDGLNQEMILFHDWIINVFQESKAGFKDIMLHNLIQI